MHIRKIELENMRRHGEAKYYSDQQVYELANLVQMFFAQQQLAEITQPTSEQ